MNFVPTSMHGQTPASTLLALTNGRLESRTPQYHSNHVSLCYVIIITSLFLLVLTLQFFHLEAAEGYNVCLADFSKPDLGPRSPPDL